MGRSRHGLVEEKSCTRQSTLRDAVLAGLAFEVFGGGGVVHFSFGL
jgi:hypothetical protein